MERRKSRKVKVGNIYIGGDAPITIQSMLNKPSTDIEGSVAQAKALEAAGCEIIRAAVPDMPAVRLIAALKEAVSVPIVADIHFDYKLAIESAAAGVDKIRINPGNIGDEGRVKAVVDVCRQRNIPIRVGVNSGSVEKSILAKYGSPTAEALVESALYHVSLLEKFDFYDTVISMKSSTVQTMVESYRIAAERCDYPLHLGVTEAGTERMGLIKSSAGLLRALDIRKGGIQFVSCPTCGRTRIDLIKLAEDVQEALKDVNKDIKVAVMGCVVNGPGEAREADIGIAGGVGCGLIFKKGEVLRKVPEEELLTELLKEIDKI